MRWSRVESVLRSIVKRILSEWSTRNVFSHLPKPVCKLRRTKMRDPVMVRSVVICMEVPSVVTH